MKKLLLVLIVPFLSFGQGWSTYYIRANVNETKRIIDYGSLAKAQAQKEANRLEAKKIAIEQAQYRDLKAREEAILNANRAIEIANDPMKAHTYGKKKTSKYHTSNKLFRFLKKRGFISYDETRIIPHKSLFENVGRGRWENISLDGITAEFTPTSANYNYRDLPYLDYEESQKYKARHKFLLEYYDNNNRPSKKNYKKRHEEYKKDLKRYYEVCDSLDNMEFLLSIKELANNPDIQENSMFLNLDGDSAYCHKKEVVKRFVYGHRGYRSTLIWEDDYAICIEDRYMSEAQDVRYVVKVRYTADKNSDLTFEDLEGRRFYLGKFIDKTVADRTISNMVYATEEKSKPKRRFYSSKEKFEKAYQAWSDKKRK